MKFEKTVKEKYVDMGYKEEEEIASKYLEIHYIELPKFKKKRPNTKEKLDQWLWLLSGEEDKIKMAEKENKEVKKAVRTLEQISADPKEREMYDSIIQAEFNESITRQKMLEMGREEGREEGREAGRKEGRKEGRQEGEKQKEIEIAKKMKEEGIDIKIIQKITNLTEKEINLL